MKKHNYFVSFFLEHENGSMYGDIVLQGNKKLNFYDLSEFKGIIFETVIEKFDFIGNKVVILSIYHLGKDKITCRQKN